MPLARAVRADAEIDPRVIRRARLVGRAPRAIHGVRIGAQAASTQQQIAGPFIRDDERGTGQRAGKRIARHEKLRRGHGERLVRVVVGAACAIRTVIRVRKRALANIPL